MSEREEQLFRKLKPPVMTGPCMLDASCETNRPMSLPEDRDEAIKADKLEEWEVWHRGLLERQAEARDRFDSWMVEEVKRWGLERVEAAIREDKVNPEAMIERLHKNLQAPMADRN